MVMATFNIPNYTPLHLKSPIQLIISLPLSFIHIQYRRTDLHPRQPIWLHRVACVPYNNAQTTMWEDQIIMLEIHQPKTLNSGNLQIIFLHHWGIVTHLCCHHFKELPSSTTLPNSTGDQAQNEALVCHPNDIGVMGHHGNDMTSPKKHMVDPKCSHRSNPQDRGRHLPAHLKCPQHRMEPFQSIR
jgi:hypothetical protein